MNAAQENPCDSSSAQEYFLRLTKRVSLTMNFVIGVCGRRLPTRLAGLENSAAWRDISQLRSLGQKSHTVEDLLKMRVVRRRTVVVRCWSKKMTVLDEECLNSGCQYHVAWRQLVWWSMTRSFGWFPGKRRSVDEQVGVAFESVLLSFITYMLFVFNSRPSIRSI